MKRLESKIKPKTVTMDFEKAAMNAVQEAFGEIEIHGCFYHLTQNIYRKIQANDLQECYMNDEDVSVSANACSISIHSRRSCHQSI